MAPASSSAHPAAFCTRAPMAISAPPPAPQLKPCATRSTPADLPVARLLHADARVQRTLRSITRMISVSLQRFALAAALLWLAACSRSPETNTTSAAPTSAVLLRGAGAEPDSLDPQKARSVESQGI